MSSEEFDATFQRIQAAGITYGSAPHQAENMQGPAMTHGAHGLGKAVYCHDSGGHLLEIKTV